MPFGTGLTSFRNMNWVWTFDGPLRRNFFGSIRRVAHSQVVNICNFWKNFTNCEMLSELTHICLQKLLTDAIVVLSRDYSEPTRLLLRTGNTITMIVFPIGFSLPLNCFLKIFYAMLEQAHRTNVVKVRLAVFTLMINGQVLRFRIIAKSAFFAVDLVQSKILRPLSRSSIFST